MAVEYKNKNEIIACKAFDNGIINDSVPPLLLPAWKKSIFPFVVRS